jgi:protein-tyrosine-phosphatase
MLAQPLGPRTLSRVQRGSHPRGHVHPLTLEVLERHNFQLDGLRSKSWDEFARPDSPPLDFVFTVCDQAAGEVCPIWPGQPMTAHWGILDPAAVVGTKEVQLRAFQRAYLELDTRIRLFTSLPFDQLDQLSVQHRLDDIGGIRLPSTQTG